MRPRSPRPQGATAAPIGNGCQSGLAVVTTRVCGPTSYSTHASSPSASPHNTLGEGSRKTFVEASGPLQIGYWIPDESEFYDFHSRNDLSPTLVRSTARLCAAAVDDPPQPDLLFQSPHPLGAGTLIIKGQLELDPQLAPRHPAPDRSAARMI